ncbi:DUF6228 family protein [Kutzneria sp. 744]|uniref:DUF6228 family protein n=1 Tax=Kutzneria sp. (strain 744) TaxID=345341 RepID=UPI000694F6E5|nr:DUF6228 family protein [Kutzneria sp. 744]
MKCRAGTSFEGWIGAKTWESLDRDLRIEAVFRSRGHVEMTWGLAPWRGNDVWKAQVTFEIEAGEQMRGLAEDMRALLG